VRLIDRRRLKETGVYSCNCNELGKTDTVCFRQNSSPSIFRHSFTLLRILSVLQENWWHTGQRYRRRSKSAGDLKHNIKQDAIRNHCYSSKKLNSLYDFALFRHSLVFWRNCYREEGGMFIRQGAFIREGHFFIKLKCVGGVRRLLLNRLQ